MEQRFVGRTGLEVSELGLGTMTFGREIEEQDSHRILDRFVEAGGTFVDTADVYSYGRAEEIVGSWLKGRTRDDLVIATKVYAEWGVDEPVRGAGRKHIHRAVEASLRRLGTDYIDLYQVHVFDDVTPLEETLSTMDTLVRSGKVRFVGASNYPGWQLQKAIDLSRQHNWESYVCLQPLYNLLDRDAELDLIPVCLDAGAGVIPWSPLAGGWLSGKYERGMTRPPAGTREGDAPSNQDDPWGGRDNERTWQVVDALHKVASETGKSPAQVALRWLLQRPGVTAPIVGARTDVQLETNLGATGWSLTPEQMVALTEASDRPLPYPHNILALPQFRRRR